LLQKHNKRSFGERLLCGWDVGHNFWSGFKYQFKPSRYLFITTRLSGIIINIFFPAIGTLVVGKIGQGIIQLILFIIGILLN
jgi:hypothetical protein